MNGTAGTLLNEQLVQWKEHISNKFVLQFRRCPGEAPETAVLLPTFRLGLEKLALTFNA